MEFPLEYKVKQSNNGKFPSHYKLAQSILKRKFPSVDKPLQKQAPQKGPLKNISPGAFFSEFYGMFADQGPSAKSVKINSCTTKVLHSIQCS